MDDIDIEALSARDRAVLAAILTVGGEEQRQAIAGQDADAYSAFALGIREEVLGLHVEMHDLRHLDAGGFHQTIAQRASEAIAQRHPDLAPLVIERAGYLFSCANR
jgi:hypothetical protein